MKRLYLLVLVALQCVGSVVETNEVIFFDKPAMEYVVLPQDLVDILQQIEMPQILQEAIDEEHILPYNIAQQIIDYACNQLDNKSLLDYKQLLEKKDASILLDENSIKRIKRCHQRHMCALFVNELTAGTLKVLKNTVISRDLQVAKDAFFRGNFTVLNDLTVRGSITVEGGIIVAGNETVNGTFTVNGNTFLNGNEQVTGNVEFTGSSATTGPVFRLSGSEVINAGINQSGLTVFGDNGAAAAVITNVGSATALIVTAGSNGALQVTGITNINTTGSATTNIGNLSGGAVIIQAGAASHIMESAGAFNMSAPGNVNINATGSGMTAIGSPTSDINTPGLTASQKVVTDASKNLATIAYTSAATANTFVFRDAFGRFMVADPVANNDVANKEYVDTQIEGLSAKELVQVVATTPVAVLSGPQVIDGVALVAGDRVLLVAQGGAIGIAHINNGIWVVQAGAWTRPADYASGTPAAGDFVFVAGGTHAGTGWVVTTQPPNDIIDVDPIAWEQFSTPGSTTGANVGAGTGLVFRDKTFPTLNFRTLLQSNHTVIITGANAVTISTDAVITPATPNTLIDRSAAGAFTAAAIGATSLTTSGNITTSAGNSTAAGSVSGNIVSSTGTFTAGSQFLGSDGTAGAPTFATTADPDAGMYLSAPNVISFSTSGVNRFSISATGTTETGNISSSGQFLGPGGNALAPTYSYTGNTNMGMFSDTVDTVSFSTAGVKRVTIDSNAITSTLVMQAANGTVGAPSYSFSAVGNTNTGIYRNAASTVGFSTNGVNALLVNGSGQALGINGTAALPTFSFIANNNTGMRRGGANIIEFDIAGAAALTMSTNETLLAGQFLGPVGSAGAPTYSFGGTSGLFYNLGALGFSAGGNLILNLDATQAQAFAVFNGATGAVATPTYGFTADTNTGIHLNGAATIGISVNGADRVIINSSNQILGPNGTAGAPAFSFLSNANTGLYRSAADSFNVSTGGTNRLTINPTGQLLAGSGAVATPTYSFTNSTNSGLFFVATALDFVAAGVIRLLLTNSGAGTVTFRPNSGTATAINMVGSSVSQRIVSGSATTTAGVLTVNVSTQLASTIAGVGISIAGTTLTDPPIITVDDVTTTYPNVNFTARLRSSGALVNTTIHYLITGTSV